MKKRVLTTVLVLLVLALTVCGLFSCGRGNDDNGDNGTPGDQQPKSEVISGVWYYGTADGEYLLSFDSNLTATLLANGEMKTGSYFLKDGNMTLKMNGDEIAAAVSGDVITLDYGDAQYRYLRRTAYTVTYNSNGGSDVASDTAINGQAVNKPADPQRDGYVFLGWYADSALTTPWAFGTAPVTGNTTLYARWAQKVPGQAEYTVSFDLGYDATAPAAVRTIGGKVYDVTAPSRDGYTFRGWWISDSDRADALTCVWTEDTVFTENTTLYALWEGDATGSKLPAPRVTVAGNDISWNSVSGAGSYYVEVIGPEGDVLQSGSIGGTSASFDFSEQPAGDYTVRVTAMASSAANNSEPAVRVLRNKALARVSLFSVAEPSTLLWNAVENAEKYYITVRCGNGSHTHVLFDNGNSTNYNFSNCEMREGGIEFIVTAVADGYATSTSATFTYERKLAPVTGLHVNSETETLVWDAVDNAAEYVLVIRGNGEEKVVRVSGTTSYCLKNYAPVAGGMTVSVYPVSRGYNSPAPVEYRYSKTTIATPGGLSVQNGQLVWDAVKGATGYDVRINSKIVSTDTNSYDLTAETEAAVGTVWKFSVRAKGSSVSLWSDEMVCATGAMTGTPRYASGTVFWTPVLGADYYEVRVNDGAIVRVDGATSASVVLTQAGNNTVSVRFCNGTDSSEWKSISVYAYTVSFDTRGGVAVPSVYVARGDAVSFPGTDKTGYDFTGWYNAPGGAAGNAGRYTDTVYAESVDIMLFASWSSKGYNIIYDFCGGTGSTESKKVAFGEPFTLEVPKNADGAVVFSGWYSEPNGAGIRYTDEFGVSMVNWLVPGDATLYACWLNVLSFDYIEADEGYSVSQGPGIGLVTRVEIPETYNGKPVTIVEGYAFKSCSKLQSISIPNTVEVVEVATAFYGCTSLSEIVVRSIPSAVDPLYFSDRGVLLYSNRRTGELEIAYYPVARNASYDVPDGVTVIPPKAFSGSQITAVSLPASLKSIEINAFYNCKQLTSVTFRPTEEGDTPVPLTFGSYAFRYCTSLVSFLIPARTAEFSVNVFDYCSNLEYVDVEEGNPNYASVGGVICSLDVNGTKDALVFCPAGRSGSYTIPAGVTKIGQYAFNRCSKLTEVVIPVYVTFIDKYAFNYCNSVAKVVFEGTREEPLTIGDYAFYSCSGIEELDFQENSNVVTIGKSAFSGARKLQTLCIPASVESIGNSAFSNCIALRELSFEAGGKDLTFGTSVFSGCVGLTTVNIPAHLKEIGTGVFSGCVNLQNVFVDPENPALADIDGVLFDKGITTLKFYPYGRAGAYAIPDTVTTVEASVFASNACITSVTIPTSVTVIGNNAFKGCTSLEEVIFAAGGEEEVTLGTYTFSGCTSLQRVTLTDRVTVISNYCFQKCSMLTEITLPDTLVTIGNYAFSYAGITSISFPDTLEVLGSNSFEYTYLTSVTIPASVAPSLDIGTADKFTTSKGNSSFSYCYYLREVTIESGITGIPVAMFFNCTALERVYIPNTVTAIGTTAFKNCTSLSELVFEEGGTGDLEIGVASFYSDANGPFTNCTSLTSVVFPARTTLINVSAFQDCTGLTSVEFAEGSRLQYIGKKAFQGCTHITEVSIPGTVTEMGLNVFYGCSELAVATFENGTEALEIPSGVFGNCKALTDLYLGNRVSALPSAALGTTSTTLCSALRAIHLDSNPYLVLQDGVLFNANKTEIYCCPAANAITDLVLPDTLTAIGDKAFQYCTTLESVTVPASVTVIGASAFDHCSALKTVIFLPTPAAEGETAASTASSLLVIGNSCFAYTALERVVIPDSVVAIGTNTFNYCASLVSVTLPAALGKASATHAVPALGTTTKYADFSLNCFANCFALQEVNISASATNYKSVDGVLLTKDGKTLLYYPAGKTDVTYTIPAGVTTIGMTTSSHAAKVSSSAAPFYKNQYLQEIVIPTAVTAINTYSFSNAVSLKTVTITSGRTSDLTFGGTGSSDSPFLNCDAIEEIYIPAKVKLRPYLFGGSSASSTCDSLRSVTIATDSALTEIPNYCFRGCKQLTTVTLGSKITKIGTYAFYDCTSLTDLSFLSGVTNIGNSSFYNCGVITLTIPNKLTTIGTSAFSKCLSLTEVTFEDGNNGANVKKLPSSIFNGCTALRKITFSSTTNAFDTGAFGGTGFETFVVPEGVTALPGNFLQNNKTVTTVILPSTLTSIGNNAFQGCSALTTVVIPSKVTSIGNYAFQNCTSLETLVLPEGLTTLGNNVFSGCSALREITIPAGVAKIDTNAFLNCTSLVSVRFADDAVAASIGATAFKGCTSLTSVAIPGSVKTLGKEAFRGCTALEEIAFPEGMTDIGEGAFQDCVLLSEVALPDTVVTVAKNAFNGCLGLTRFEMLVGVTTIGDGAFGDCVLLEGIYIPGTVTTIGTNPFAGCAALSRIDLAPDNASFSVLDNALYDVDRTKLISYPASAYGPVRIPDTVTSIADGAFRGAQITSVTLPEELTAIGAYTFEGCGYLTSVNLPEGITTIGNYAFANTGVTYVKMGDKITTIGNYAFYNTPLQSVTIGSTVTAVGQYAFADCTALSSLVFEQTGNSVLKLDSYAFFGCTALEEITLPKRLRSYATSSNYSYVSAVGVSCFENCTNLTAVHFGDEGGVGLQLSTHRLTFGSRAFAGCTSLAAIDCVDYVADITYYAPSSQPVVVPVFGGSCFEGCTSLARVTFTPTGTAGYSFGSYAFRGCTALTSIDLPDSTNKIETGAFAESGLTEIVIPEKVSYFSLGETFRDCKSLTRAVILCKATSVPSKMFAGCTALQSVVLPTTISSIGTSAFEGCTALTELTIPETVTFIQRDAFKDCTALKELRISGKVQTVYEDAFAGWTAEQTIYIAFADADSLPDGWREGWDNECEAQIVWGA